MIADPYRSDVIPSAGVWIDDEREQPIEKFQPKVEVETGRPVKLHDKAKTWGHPGPQHGLGQRLKILIE